MRTFRILALLFSMLTPVVSPGSPRDCFDFGAPSTPLPRQTVMDLQDRAWARSRQEGGDVNLDGLIHPVADEVGQHFDAHGVANGALTAHLPALLALLDVGVNP